MDRARRRRARSTAPCRGSAAHPRGSDRARSWPRVSHLHQRRHLAGVAEVVGVGSPGQRRTRRGLGRRDPRRDAPRQLLRTRAGERQAGSSNRRRCNRRSVWGCHLPVPAAGSLPRRSPSGAAGRGSAPIPGRTGCQGSAPRPRRLRRSRCPTIRTGWPGWRQLAADLGEVTGERCTAAPNASIISRRYGLASMGRPTPPDLALHVVQRTSERQCRSPLAGPGLGGQLRGCPRPLL